MIAYIEEFKHRYGVEPICRLLPIAPSTYYARKQRPPSARAVRDAKSNADLKAEAAAHKTLDNVEQDSASEAVARQSG